MNKLEKALSLNFTDDIYSTNDSSKSMEQISNMVNERILTSDELINKKIIFQGDNQGDLINQFRDIRTILSKYKSKNIIMISSVDAFSGTSFFARNLAAVTAFDSSRTSLLVDCNIENPIVEDTFELNGSLGLLDYIFNNEISEDEIIQAVGIRGFRCITAGRVTLGSDEYFTHPRFKNLLLSLKNRYQDRSIFLDSPPLKNSANARILLDVCDQVILVAPFGRVDSKELSSISKLIPEGKLSGLVINEYMN
jgi:protein-tyrosine kinase